MWQSNTAMVTSEVTLELTSLVKSNSDDCRNHSLRMAVHAGGLHHPTRSQPCPGLALHADAPKETEGDRRRPCWSAAVGESSPEISRRPPFPSFSSHPFSLCTGVASATQAQGNGLTWMQAGEQLPQLGGA